MCGPWPGKDWAQPIAVAEPAEGENLLPFRITTAATIPGSHCLAGPLHSLDAAQGPEERSRE